MSAEASGSMMPLSALTLSHCGKPLRYHSCCEPPLFDTVAIKSVSSPAFCVMSTLFSAHSKLLRLTYADQQTGLLLLPLLSVTFFTLRFIVQPSMAAGSSSMVMTTFSLLAVNENATLLSFGAGCNAGASSVNVGLLSPYEILCVTPLYTRLVSVGTVTI